MPAAPLERIVARLVDGILTFVIIFLGGFVVAGISIEYLGGSIEDEESFRLDRTTRIAADVASLSAAAIYEVLPTAIWGRSVGKRLFGCRVVGPTGRAPGIGRTALRSGVWLLPAIACYAWATNYPNGLLSAAAGLCGIMVLVLIPGRLVRDDQHRGLHDRLAGTSVVTSRDPLPGA